MPHGANSSSDISSHLLPPNYCLNFQSQAIWRGGSQKEGRRAGMWAVEFPLLTVREAHSRVFICTVAAAEHSCFPQGILWPFYSATVNNFLSVTSK